MNTEYLALYSTKCLKCSHLVETGTKAFAKCHYSKGNKQCPAAEVKIVIVGRAVALANRVLKARDNQDLKKEASLLAHVSNQSEAFKARFMQALNGELENP